MKIAHDYFVAMKSLPLKFEPSHATKNVNLSANIKNYTKFHKH